MTDYWSQFEEVKPQKKKNDYWSQFEEIKQPTSGQKTETVSDNGKRIAGIVEALDSGAYFGLGKKMGGLVNAIGSYPVDRIAQIMGVENTPSFSDRYHEIVDYANDAHNKFAKEHPVINLGTEFAGSIKGAPAKLLGKSLKVAANITKDAGRTAQIAGKGIALIGSGGATNVATGVGNSNDAFDYLSSSQPYKDLAYGGALNLALGTTPYVLKSIGKGGKWILGKTTGVGTEAIDRAIDAGVRKSKVFLDNMRGKVLPEDVVRKAKDELAYMAEGTSDLYNQDMNKAFANTAKLNVENVIDNLHDIVNQETLGGAVPLSGAEKSVIEQAQKFLKPAINNRTAQTTLGLDKIRRKIYDITTEPGTNAHRIKKEIEKNIKNVISEQNPEYPKGLQRYAQNKSEQEEIKRVFSLSDKASVDTALRKIQSLGRNNVQTNYGYRNTLMDKLDFSGDIRDAAFGQSFNTWMPRGIIAGGAGGANIYTAFFNPSSLPKNLIYAVASSPRVVGESAYKYGQLKKALEKINLPKQDVNIGGLNYKQKD